MRKEIYEIAIIGGGASGLMLASNLELGSSRGIMLEGSSCVGSKLLMSGGGRCNITHGGSIKEFVFAYADAGQSLRRCLYKHSNIELMRWLEARGVPLAEEEGRVFPASMKAQDILKCFTDRAAANGWEIRTGAKVKHLTKEELWRIELENGEHIDARNVAAASGGVTYPKTGSDGSMHMIMKSLGIRVTELRPALTPVYIKDYPYAELAGISLPDVTVTVFGSDAACTCKGKAARMGGDLLFTHRGFSGPVILNISRYAAEGETMRISYNKEMEQLPKRMQRILKDRARGDSGDIRTKTLASLLDHDDFIIAGTDPDGMVTAGGVDLAEIDMRTMRVKSASDPGASSGGLYVIGEALDADGITGGYNLQLCWSTACTAADDLRGYLAKA